MTNLVLLSIAFFLCVVVRASIQYARFGNSGLSLLKQPSQAVIFFGLAAVFFLQAYINQREHTLSVFCTGIMSYGCGILLTFISQLQMGSAWQVGINRKKATTLVTNGIYAVSRNPIYLALILILMGYLILTPTLTATFMVAASIYLIRRQVLKEEKFLEETFGAEYRYYKRQTPRWL